MATTTHDHHDAAHDHHAPGDRPVGSTLSASVIFSLLLIGLLIAAFNFVGIMSAEHHDEKGSTHQQHEATSTQTLSGETGLGAPQEHTTQFSGSDSQQHANMAPEH